MINLTDISTTFDPAGLLTCGCDDELGSILIEKGHSHEPIYVFDHEKFLGLISPYHTLFHNSYAYATKAMHCLLIPPHITPTTSIHDVARFMADLKLYSLPVFDDQNNIVRIITADNIISYVGHDASLMQQVCNRMEIHTPITANVHATIADVYALMREKRIGRVILINEEKKLKGILSRKDLQNVFLKQAVKTPYQTKKSTKSHATLENILITHHDEPAFRYATTKVITALLTEPPETILTKMIHLKQPSVVIIKDDVPVGFLSRQDVLNAFASFKPLHKVPIIWENSVLNFRELPMNDFYADVDAFITEFIKQIPLHNIEIHISRPPKESHTSKPSYVIKLHLHLESGKMLLSNGQGIYIQTALKNAVENIFRQSELSDKQKHDHDGRGRN